MKKTAIIFALLLSTYIFAQDDVVKTSSDFKLEISKPYPVVDGLHKWYFCHENEILTIKNQKSGDFTFQLFDANTMVQKSVSVISKKKQLPKGYVHEEFLQKGNKVYQFYNIWDKPNKTEQIFLSELGFETPSTPAKGKLVFKYEGYLKSRVGQNKIDLYQSFDKSKTLLTYQLKKTENKNKNNFETFGMIVYDETMKEVWRKEVKMPYSEAEMENMGYTLDNNGNAYLLIRKKDKDAKTPLELMKVNASPNVTMIDLKANGKYFRRGVKLQEGLDNKIYIAGYYGGTVASQGLYVAILNPSGTVEKENFYEIPLETINQYKSDKAQDKAEKKTADGDDIGIDFLALDEIKINKDGSLILVGEVFWVLTIPGLQSASNTFRYKEMMIVKIGADASLKWMKKLPKFQMRRASYPGNFGIGTVKAYQSATKSPTMDLSYQYLSNDNSHYLLYLDNVKNLNLPLNKYPAKHTSRAGGFLTAYKINDNDGAVSKLSLFDMKDLKGIHVYQFNISRIFQRSDNEMFLELYKKKKEDLMLKIELK